MMLVTPCLRVERSQCAEVQIADFPHTVKVISFKGHLEFSPTGETSLSLDF